MRTLTRFPAVLTAVVVVATLNARAQLAPVSQDRSVEASSSALLPGESDSDSDSASAPGFGLFDEGVAPNSVAIIGNSVAIGQGVAGQTSSLGPGSISGVGEASASLTLLPGADGSATGEGASLFEFIFTLAGLSTYALSGEVDTAAVVTGGSSIPTLANSFLFEDVGNAVTILETLTNDETFSISGVLPAGTYRLAASAEVDASQASSTVDSRTVTGSSSFEFNFRAIPVPIPEPATVIGALGVGVFCGIAWLRSRCRRS